MSQPDTATQATATPVVRLRPATAGDRIAVLMVENAAFAQGQRWSEASWGSELAAEDRVVLVAETEQGTDRRELVGVATARLADVAELNRVAVDPAHRRLGIGRQLIEGCLQALVGRRHELWLEVAADNQPALGLYRGLGFAEIGRRDRYYPGGVSAVIMSVSVAGAIDPSGVVQGDDHE